MAQDKNVFLVKRNNVRPEKGKILISEPFLQGISFQRAVILLVEHNAKNSMGFVLNKRTDLVVNDFLPELKHLPDIPIYLGGPVHFNHLFYIHLLGDDIVPDGAKIGKKLRFDGNFEALKRYIANGGAVEGKVKFFMGYSGWSENQLNDEIMRDSWLVGETSPQNMMLADDESFWDYALDTLGNPYTLWKNYPKNPEWN
jgi:putative transcriptional regulator